MLRVLILVVVVYLLLRWSTQIAGVLFGRLTAPGDQRQPPPGTAGRLVLCRVCGAHVAEQRAIPDRATGSYICLTCEPS